MSGRFPGERNASRVLVGAFSGEEGAPGEIRQPIVADDSRALEQVRALVGVLDRTDVTWTVEVLATETVDRDEPG